MHQNTKDKLEKVTNGYKMVTIGQVEEEKVLVEGVAAEC
jgi:hypothetical protein